MAILDTYISDLLYQYDCIVIPGFGGFVANYRPAKIDAERGRFYPPGKDIGFNINLQKNDGLLSSFLCERKDLSAEEAAKLIHDAVDTYKYTLQRGESLSFQKIGVLHMDKDNRIHFAPSGEVNYLRSSFGLESFSLPPIQNTVPAHTALSGSQTEKLPGTTILGEPSSRKRWYWAAAAFIPVLGFSYLTIKNQDPVNTSLAEIFSFGSEKALYTPVAHSNLNIKPKTVEFPKQEDLFKFSFVQNQESDSGIWVSNINISTEKQIGAPAETGVSKSTLYHIIVGCFSEEKNATELVENLRKKGKDAAVLDFHNGLHRVKMASYSDYQTALDALFATKQGEMPKAWLLKKKYK